MNTHSVSTTAPLFGTLQTSILAYVVFPLVIISAVGAAWFVNVVGDLEEDRLKEDLSLLARAVRLPIGQSLEEGNIDDVQNALLSVFQIGRVYGASIYDVDGDRIAAVGLSDRDLVDSSVAAETVATGEMQEDFRELGGLDVFSQFLPVVDSGGRINGLVQITRRMSDFDATLQDLQRQAGIIWLLLVLVMTTVVVIGHYRGVGRHVRRLLEGMASVGEGHYSRRVAPAGPQELNNIALALNRMLDSIEQAEVEVSNHQRKEQQLNEQLKDQEKMAAIGRVASGLAHELGAPLSVIDGRARRLKTCTDASEADRQLSAIQQQVSRLHRTVRQLLDYCRPDAIQHRRIELPVLIRNSIDAIESEFVGRLPKPVISVAAQEDLPPALGDTGRVELALINLLRNAGQAGAANIRISVASVDGGKRLQLQVEDDGKGFTEAPQKLLEPFYTTKLPGEGTGLGLAIVRSVAAEHGSDLKLISATQSPEGGSGCRVVFSLPVYSASDDVATEGRLS